MEISIGSCAYLGQCHIYKDVDTGSGNLTQGTTTPKYSTSNQIIAGRSGGIYYTGIIKFRTPDKPGAVSQYLDFIMPVYGHTNGVRLHYALCTSDSNYSKYYNVYSDVTESNQIAKGYVTTSNITTNIEDTAYGRYYITLPIDTQNLKPNTVYYLFLWSATSGTNYIDIWRNNHQFNTTITMGYVIGAVHIDNGTSFVMHQCYIDNGSGWDMYIPYIDNGTSWDMYS